jgi:hypothetical protein
MTDDHRTFVHYTSLKVAKRDDIVNPAERKSVVPMLLLQGDDATDDALMENAVRPLAGTFQVSAEAMRIRAEGMGLVLRKREATLF